jgi:outer membrane murein-binding lipoprotein Lpp
VTKIQMRIVTGLLIATTALLAGCSSSAKSSSTGTEAPTSAGASSPVCQSVTQFRSSLSALTEASTYTGGKASATAALDNVKSSLNGVKSTLKSGDKPKVDALQTAIDNLQSAIDNMNGISGVPDVITAGKNAATAAQGVLDALKAGCP